MAPAGGAELLVLSGRDAPELKELINLPDGMRLLDTGRPGQELQGTSTQHVCMRNVTRANQPADLPIHRHHMPAYQPCISQIGRRRIGAGWRFC